jgi:hypothetical protein
MRRPGNSFHSCYVLLVLEYWLCIMWIRNKEPVVITTRCKFTVVMRPLEPTDLRFVPSYSANIFLWSTDVMVKDGAVTAAG